MGRFTTRVELHRADESDYERLHEEMASEGFVRTITDDKGNTLHLPTAEYNWVGDVEDQHLILRKAREAATRTGRRFEILVTKSAGRTWENLTPV